MQSQTTNTQTPKEANMKTSQYIILDNERYLVLSNELEKGLEDCEWRKDQGYREVVVFDHHQSKPVSVRACPMANMPDTYMDLYKNDPNWTYTNQEYMIVWVYSEEVLDDEGNVIDERIPTGSPEYAMFMRHHRIQSKGERWVACHWFSDIHTETTKTFVS
jgi:hypothetical protein